MTLNFASQNEILTSLFGTGTFYLALADEQTYTHEIDASTGFSGTDVTITMQSSAPAPVVGTRFTFSTSASLPSVVNNTDIYYVKSVSGSGGTRTITIASVSEPTFSSGTPTITGDAIDFTGDAGSGTHTLTELVPRTGTSSEMPLFSVADFARHELSAYPDSGTTNRPTLTVPSITFDDTGNDMQYALTTTIDNTSGSSAIDWRFAAIIGSGSATPGDTTGVVLAVGRHSSVQTIGAGQALPYTFTFGGAMF